MFSLGGDTSSHATGARSHHLDTHHLDTPSFNHALFPAPRSVVVDVETGALVEARELITTDGLQEAYEAISKKPHPR